MPTPTKGGYLFYSPICEFPYRLIISRNGFTRFGKGVVNRYTPPSLVIHDAGSHETLVPYLPSG